MKSVTTLEDGVNYRVVMFDDTGSIVTISGKDPDEQDVSFARFEFEAVRGFLNGEKRLSDYIVSQTSNPQIFEIVKRQVKMHSRSKSSSFHKVSYCNDPEVVLLLENNKITVTASDSVVEEADVDINNEVTIAGKKVHDFYITVRDNPNFVISKVSVPFNYIFSGNTYEIETNFSKDEVSIYTKKYFNSYSLV